MRLDPETSKAAVERYPYDSDVVDVEEFDRRQSLVYVAVERICDGTWLQLYEHWDEVTTPGAVAMALTGVES